MTYYAASGAANAYDSGMFDRFPLLRASAFGLLACRAAHAVPAESAADTQVVTGVSNVGPALIIIAVACVLLLTLLFRGVVSRIYRSLTTRIGRWRINRVLERRSTEILHDVILPGAYGGLTRIDHAILTSGGIICILAKHYNGVVFGEPDEPQWTNVDGIRRRKFLNPQIQNQGRVRALENALPDVPIANLVVFTGAVQFTSAREKNVIHVRELDSYIAKFVFGPSKIKDWDAVWLSLNSAALTDEDSRRDFSAQLSFG